MDHKFEPLQLLRYTRHDWLNRLQIIQGQLYLGSPEKVEQYIKEVSESEKNAAYFTQLNCEDTTLFLVAHNWGTSAISIYLKGEGSPQNWSAWDKELQGWITFFVSLLEVHADLYETHSLYITANGMAIYFDFNGKLNEINVLEQKMKEQPRSSRLSVEQIGRAHV